MPLDFMQKSTGGSGTMSRITNETVRMSGLKIGDLTICSFGVHQGYSEYRQRASSRMNTKVLTADWQTEDGSEQ